MMEPGSSGSELVIVREKSWREQLVKLCAQLLGKSEQKLKEEYDSKASFPNNAFSIHSLEYAPRDFADFVIMMTLKSKNIILKKNSCSWLFNLMDRTGAGYVLRDEFVRYSPYMSPAADEAHCSKLFTILISIQEKTESEQESDTRQETGQIEDIIDSEEEETVRPILSHLRRQKRSLETLLPSVGYIFNTLKSEDAEVEIFKKLRPPIRPSFNLFPLSSALRFRTWKIYYEKVVELYYNEDAEWNRVKTELGIDPSEVLINSEAALVHVDIIPSMGKLYLSQRYLIFFASVGRNHYLARLGAVLAVNLNSIPLRDVIDVYLASEVQAARDGITQGSSIESRNDESISKHVERLMRRFTSGEKPLRFSFLELSNSSKRDSWILMLKEIIAAHKLHNAVGFGNNGRLSPLSTRMHHRRQVHNQSTEVAELSDTNFSLFKSEPMTPLLVVAAHANVSRHRTLLEIGENIAPNTFLIFSHTQGNNGKMKWYVESVRRHDTWNQKSWIERFLTSVQNNMESNERLYRASDEKPFDIQDFSSSVGRLAELCSPFARFIQYWNHLFQWRNPPATILASMTFGFICRKGLISYIPSLLFLLVLLYIIEARMNYLGLNIGKSSDEEAEEEQKNVLQMVAQVHDALQASQNVITRINIFLGKIQTLSLWRSHPWQSCIALLLVSIVILVLSILSVQTLFVVFVFFMFAKHFLPPSNPFLRYWDSIPP